MKRIESFDSGSTEREASKEMPKLHFDIFYSAHSGVEEFKGLEDLFQETDVYVPEGSGWGEEIANIYRQASEGSVDFDTLRRLPVVSSTPSLLKDCEMIYGAHKPIILADLPRNHPLSLQLSDIKQKVGTNLQGFAGGKFHEAFQRHKDFLQQFSKLNSEREIYMKGQIQENIKQLLAQVPALRQKPELKILIRIGTGHTTLGHSLRVNEKVTSHFSSEVFVLNYLSEAMRRFRFDRVGGIDLAVARSALQGFVYPMISPHISGSQEAIRISRKIVDQLDFEQIQKISESKILQKPKGLEKYLQSLGIKVPRSKKEAVAMLASDIRFKNSAPP